MERRGDRRVAWGHGGMTQQFEQAWHFVNALTGDANNAVMDYRAIHDTDKGVPGIPFRGTINECWQSIVFYNSQGYGIFAVIAAMDGVGRHLSNVSYLRASYIDLDGLDAQQQYEKACMSSPMPAFAVNSSYGPLKDGNGKPTSAFGNKFHVYWPVQPYQGNDRFSLVQRKLRQVFNSDKVIIDASRVMRLPGTYHLKDSSNPFLVTMHMLGGWGSFGTIEALEAALASVNIIDGGAGERYELGAAEMAAPNLSWATYALGTIDPNQLDRAEWISFMAAFKQAFWSLSDEATLFDLFSQWCARYEQNDPAENRKQWDSIRNTEVGWKSLVARNPALKAQVIFQGVDRTGSLPTTAQPGVAPTAHLSAMPTAEQIAPALDCSGEYLTHIEQQYWFRDCMFVSNLGLIYDRDGRFLNPAKFNGKYSGKNFIIDGNGKKTNEAWQAATRSTLWRIPVVDHVRFVPKLGYLVVIPDDLGREGLNVYRPAIVKRVQGDVTPFLNHIAALLPDQRDQKILLDYLAHNIKYPGEKIAWAPVIQSAEGAGKGVLKRVMKHAIGKTYTYFPKASELAESGAKFNAWLRHKLFILVDEIKVDERRELIEVLKPLISEDETEVQSKGVDQELDDNFSNWLFFSNWKDAIPINRNARRFAIMYSPLQTVDDLALRGMNDAYFTALYDWLDYQDGCAIVTDWFMNYPIERGAIPRRAPVTSSTDEAVVLSRSPIERLIIEAIEDGAPGFKGGWVSTIAVMTRIKEAGTIRGISTGTLGTILEAMGFVASGRAPRPFFAEHKDTRTNLYHWAVKGAVEAYGRAQGYE